MLLRIASCTLALLPNVSEHSWTSRAGPTGNFRQTPSAPLTATFGTTGPRVLWRKELGAGYSGVLYAEDRLVIHFREGDEEVVAVLSAADGDVHWQHHFSVTPYEDMAKEFGEGPNATPILHGEHVFACGIDGQVRCLDFETGELAWRVDLHERYGRQKRKEEYGFSSSPLVVRDTLVLLVGGKRHAVVGLRLDDGSHAWGSAPGRVSYAQPTLVPFPDGPQLVYFSPTAVIGINPFDGSPRWSHPVKCFTENNLTPALHLGERYLWVAAQLDGGTRVLEVPKLEDEDVAPEVLWEEKRLTQAHWDSFVIGDLVVGSMGGNSSSTLAGVNWRTGEVEWRYRGLHLAKGVLADGRFYFLDENGQLSIARFSPQGVEILGSHQLLERVSWTPPILVGTRLFARDASSLVAVELSAEAYVP